jgi:hypothetical protein
LTEYRVSAIALGSLVGDIIKGDNDKASMSRCAEIATEAVALVLDSPTIRSRRIGGVSSLSLQYRREH